MRADQKLVDGEPVGDGAVYLVDGCHRLRSARDIRLIRDHQEQEAAFPQACKAASSSINNPQVVNRRGWIGLAVPNDGFVQHAIAIEKHGPAAHR
jgi:hypothetical protein